jgi:catechol 2,3-dioxygenase-like lactoylglutathione lyase family enzyme
LAWGLPGSGGKEAAMEKAKGFGLYQIGQIAIPVHGLDRAVDFYRDVLGMRILFQVPNMAFFDCGGVRLMLGVPEAAESDHRASLVYYKVEDISQAFKELSQRGVEFTSEPHLVARMEDHELWMAFFKDVDDNILALMSEVLLKE